MSNLPMTQPRIGSVQPMLAILALHVEAAQAHLAASVHVPSDRPGSAEPLSDHPAHVRIRRSNGLVAVTHPTAPAVGANPVTTEAN